MSTLHTNTRLTLANNFYTLFKLNLKCYYIIDKYTIMDKDLSNPVIFTIVYTFASNYFCLIQNCIIINVELRQNDLNKSTILIESTMLDKLKQIDNTSSIPDFNSGSIAYFSQLRKFSNISELIHFGQRTPMASTYNHVTNKWIMPECVYDTKIKTYYARGLISTNNHKLYNGFSYCVNLES